MTHEYWDMLDFSHEDCQIIYLYEKFKHIRDHFMSHLTCVKILPLKKDPRDSKNWKFFKNLREIKKQFPDVPITEFITAQVLACKDKGMKHCPPSWLSGDMAFDRYVWYLDYRDTLTEAHDPNYQFQIQLDGIKKSTLFILKTMKESNIKTFSELFYMRTKSTYLYDCYLWITMGNISKTFLALSKSYYAFYDKLDMQMQTEYPSVYELSKIRKKLMMNNDVRLFCKKYLKKESLI